MRISKDTQVIYGALDANGSATPVAKQFATTSNSNAYDLRHVYGYSIHAKWTVVTPSATTMSGTHANVITLASDSITKASHGFVTGLVGQLTTTAQPSANAQAAANYTVATKLVTATAHGFITGCKGQLTTSGVLPTGLSLATDYYLVVTGVNNYGFATSLADAIASTPVLVAFSDQGTGNHTFTPTASALPTGLSAATNYYAIYVDANTYKLASSAANALAGTAVDITATGAQPGTKWTFTPTSISGGSAKLQGSVDGANWINLTISDDSQTISADSEYMWNVAPAMYPFVRIQNTVTAGQVSMLAYIHTKGA